MLHIKQVVDIIIDESANDDGGAILLDPTGWRTFVCETGLLADAPDRICYRGVVVMIGDRLGARADPANKRWDEAPVTGPTMRNRQAADGAELGSANTPAASAMHCNGESSIVAP